MPGRKSYAKKRKPYPRRKYNKRQYIPRAIVPYRKLVRLPYQEDITLAVTSGAITTYAFSLNSMYDTNQTGTGHQPRGFDSMLGTSGGSGLYRNYTVLGTKMQINAIHPSTTDSLRIGLAVRDVTGAGSDATDYMEASNSRSKIVGPIGNRSNNAILTLKWSAKKWFGVKNILDEHDLQGDYGSNPGRQAFAHIWADGAGGTGTYTFRVQVTMSFIAMLTNPVIPTQS